MNAHVDDLGIAAVSLAYARPVEIWQKTPDGDGIESHSIRCIAENSIVMWYNGLRIGDVGQGNHYDALEITNQELFNKRGEKCARTLALGAHPSLEKLDVSMVTNTTVAHPTINMNTDTGGLTSGPIGGDDESGDDEIARIDGQPLLRETASINLEERRDNSEQVGPTTPLVSPAPDSPIFVPPGPEDFLEEEAAPVVPVRRHIVLRGGENTVRWEGSQALIRQEKDDIKKSWKRSLRGLGSDVEISTDLPTSSSEESECSDECTTSKGLDHKRV
jgi:hypothetical protein